MIEESLHGPWLVKMTDSLLGRRMSVVINGSDGADDRYVIEPDTDLFEVPVDGGRWTIQLDVDEGGTWVPAEADPPTDEGGARRRMWFEAGPGLIVSLETGSWAWHPDLGVPFSDIFRPGLRLECVSQDPSTNPIPAPNPFDFTLPHGPRED